MTITQRIRDLCMYSPLPELAIMAIITIALVASRASAANIDVDRIQIVSQVHTQLSVQQEHAWVTLQGYYELHNSDGYLTLDVTDAKFAADPLIPWFSCRNTAGGTSCPVEQDPDYNDEQLSTWDFPCPPTDDFWYFRLTLWVQDVPIDSYYFFSGVGAYRP